MKALLLTLLLFLTAFASFSQTEIKIIKQTVDSDGHPVALWEKGVDTDQAPILFIHGRTWSAVPDFDLQVAGEDLSLMDGMIAKGYSTYAIDLRGYGATPRDSSGWLSPGTAAKDVANILDWIAKKHDQKVHVFGWSQGSVIALLTTMKFPQNIETLTLFGFWKNLDREIPLMEYKEPRFEKNTAKNAASDFIVPGAISQKAIDEYVRATLASDPIRTDLSNLHEYNAIDPSQITLPVLLLQGEFDPIAPTDTQAKLFTRLSSSRKSWVVIPGGDHAAFMEKPRSYFIESFAQFLSGSD